MGLENGQRQIVSFLDDGRRGFKSTKRTETLQIKKGALKEDVNIRGPICHAQSFAVVLQSVT